MEDVLADPPSARRSLGRFPTFAHQEHFPDMLRVLRKVDEGRREVGAGDVVWTVAEVFPSDLRSNPAGLRPIRKIGRADDGPIDLAGRNQPLHPTKVCVWLP